MDLLGILGYKVELDPSGVERGADRATRQVAKSMKEIDAMRGTAHITAEMRDLDKSIADARAKLLRLEASKAEVEIEGDTSDIDADIARVRKELKLLSADRVEIAVRLRGAQQALRESKQVRNAIATEGMEVAKLRERYNRLGDEMKRLEKKRIWERTEGDRLRIQALGAEMGVLDQRIRHLGGSVDDINVDVEENQHSLRRWANSLANIRVHLGVMSLTIKQFGIAVLTLGPLLVSVAGTLATLVGVLGTGLAGAIATGTAMMGGFALATTGSVLALKPYTQELGSALEASKKLSEAQNVYGRGSEEAKDAQEELNKVMKGMSPEVRNAIRDFGRLRDEWRKQTAGVRQPFFETFAEGIQTARALMPTFARETTATFRTASRGAQDWLRGLRGAEAQGLLGDLMGGFRQSLPALMSGLGEIGSLLGRISASTAGFLPELTGGFRQWASSMADAVGSGAALDSRIGRLVDHMQQVGHFAQASGRLLVTFFSAGANEGSNLLAGMTDTFDEWSDWMQSVEGQDALQEFFSRSTRLTSSLVGALGSLSEMLFRLSGITAPFVNLFLQGAEAAFDLANALLSIPGATTLLGWVVAGRAFYGTMKLLGKLGGMTALGGLFSGLLGGGAAAGAGGIFAKAASGAETLALRALYLKDAFMKVAPIATKLAGPVGVFSTVVTAASWASEALEEDLNVVATGFTRYQHASAVASAASNRYLTTQRQLKTELGNVRTLQRASTQAIEQHGQKSVQAQQALLRLAQAQERASTKQMVLNMQFDRYYRSTANAAAFASQDLESKLVVLGRAQEQNIVRSAQQANIYPQLLARQRALGGGYDALVIAARQLGLAWGRETIAGRLVEEASRRRRTAAQAEAAATVEAIRRMRGIQPIAAAARQSVGQFVREFGNIKGAKNILLRVNDSEVTQRVAKASNALNRLNRRKAVVQILGNSKDAEGKANQLEAKLAKIRRQKHTAKIDADTGGAKSKLDPFLRDFERLSGETAKPKINVQSNAEAQASAAKSALSGISDENVFLNVYRRNMGPGGYQGGPMGFAGGTTDARMMERAYNSAAGRASQDGQFGARVNKPTYITGEENKTEWVIAENPAYRRSNTSYLADAAASFGYALVPGFKRGRGKKGKGYRGPDEFSGSPLGQQYQALQDQLTMWEQEFDLDRRDYDRGVTGGGGPGVTGLPGVTGSAGPGTSGLNDLLFDIDQQIAVYTRLASLIPQIQKMGGVRVPEIPRKVAKAANKEKAGPGAKRRLRRWEAQQQAASNFNADLKSTKKDVREELRDIPYLIRGLQIDRAEIQTASANATALGTQQANMARFEAAKAFGSNIGGLLGGGGPSIGAIAPVTPPTPGFVNPGRSSAVNFALAAGGAGPSTFGSPKGAAPSASGAAPKASGDTIITNNFAAPPPDPHTWTQQQAFEVSAL